MKTKPYVVGGWLESPFEVVVHAENEEQAETLAQKKLEERYDDLTVTIDYVEEPD